MYTYNGNVSSAFLSKALEALRRYEADKEPLMRLLRDDERYYTSWHEKTIGQLKSHADCSTPLLFSAIENAVASASENYPAANILERDPEGETAADVLSKLLPTVLDMSDYKNIYKSTFRNKCKYGTSVCFVGYNDFSGEVELNEVSIADVFVDYHVDDPQDSKFLFIKSVVDNDELKERYPERAAEFTGDAVINGLNELRGKVISDASVIIDCYYKKRGALHIMKIFNDNILAATEDMPGYENGLYDHGLYPVVFDRMYLNDSCPYGFGMIDIAKNLQYKHDAIDMAITENIMCGAKPRYLAKRNSGIDEKAFADFSKNVVFYEGDPEACLPIRVHELNANYLTMKTMVTDNFKEIVANRDVQQGQTSGGVIAASAIQALQVAGEKRVRSGIDDTYNAFKQICSMIIELIRQFYKDDRTFRTVDSTGRKTFVKFSNDMLYKSGAGTGSEPVYFDLEIVPQKENPYTSEQYNNTVMTLYKAGLMNPENFPVARAAISNMKFDGKEQLLSMLEDNFKEYEEKQQYAAERQQVAAQTQQVAPQMQQNQVPASAVGDPGDIDMSNLVEIPIA